MAEINCRHFSGYKPCKLNPNCDASCPSKALPSQRILLIHLGAMGAVVRSSTLITAIRRKYPGCHLTWITGIASTAMVERMPGVDRVLAVQETNLRILESLEFDVGFCVDKSLEATSILKKMTIKESFGFTHDARSGAIVPVNLAAQELWDLGLNDHKKFFVNKKSEAQLTAEALELPWQRDPYAIQLSSEENQESRRRKYLWSQGESVVIGINTGCSPMLPAKKFSIDGHRKLIEKLNNVFPQHQIVLLGGRDEKEQNHIIARGFPVIESATDQGVIDGMISIAACDIVISGDSLAMHLAIALQKWVVTWFGPSCPQEIDLYDQGVKVLTKVPCSPCWKKDCSKNPMCYDQVSWDEMIQGVYQGLSWLQKNKKAPSKILDLPRRSPPSL